MVAYFGIPSTGIATWDRHWYLDGDLTSSLGGDPLIRYAATGSPDPTALRFTTPIAGTTGLSFNSVVDNPTRSPYIAIEDPALARTGEISIAFIAISFNASRSSGTYFRYGLDPAIRSWADEDDNDLYRFDWTRLSGSAFSMASGRFSWMTGGAPTTVLRQTAVGLNEALPTLFTFYRSAGPSPVLEVTMNGAVVVSTSDEWPGDVAPYTVAPLVSPTGGTTTDARFFLGENFCGALISPAVKFGKLTGATGKAIGETCDGEIGALYTATLEPIFGARR